MSFGTPFGASAGAGAGMFGAASAAGASTSPFPKLGSSILGQPSQPAAASQPTGSLFAGAAAPTSAASSFFAAPKPQTAGGGLFGGAAPAQPQTSGGIPAGPAQSQMTGGSLFGAAAPAQPQTTGGNLFGATATTSQPQQASLFGAAAPGTSAFGASLLSAPTLVGGASAPHASSTPQATGTYFDSLLAKSKKQADGEAAAADLPSLQLGLGDLRQRLRRLGPHGQERPPDGKAHYLLAASGVDPGAAVKDLGSLGLHAGAAAFDRPPPPELDVETYLSNLQTKTTMSMIADGLERSVRDFDSFLEDNVTMEWEAQRRRIYDHFGIKPRDVSEVPAPAGGGKEPAGGFGRSRRSRLQQSSSSSSSATATAGTPRPSQKKSAFGRSSLQKSLIGTPSRIGAHPSEFADVEASAEPLGSLGGGPAADDRFVREKQAKLADKMRALNDSRMLRRPYPVLHQLAEVEARSGDRHAPHLVEAYRAMTEVVGEDPDADAAQPQAGARERAFARSYLDPNPNSVNALALRRRILAGANRHLERQFFAEVEATIARYQTEATLGGRPDVVSKIRAYVRVRSAHKKLVADGRNLQAYADEYVWAVVFYLLRSGHVNEAATYVNDNQTAFRNIDRTFSAYINSYASSDDRRLKRAMQDRCSNEYNQRLRSGGGGASSTAASTSASSSAPASASAADGGSGAGAASGATSGSTTSVDPFRLACYKVIGRCDVGNRSLDGLHTDVNDWIWLQFNLAREGDRSSELAGEMYGLADLQASIREIGLKHFPKTSAEDASGSFGMFFYLQVLAGLYEQAVAYLYAFSYVDAVHFAVALAYYGLLRSADPFAAANDLLSHSSRGLPQINFARMLGYYTRDFRAANAAVAVEYLVLICLDADDTATAAGGAEPDRQAATALCHEALRELVLETREFSKLVGDIRPDGKRIRGAIEERGPLVGLERESDLIRAISRQAASAADEGGRTTDAVLLYHLAGDYDAVVTIASRALSEAVSLDLGEEPMRLVPVKPRVDGASGPAALAAAAAAGYQPGSSLSLAAIDDPVELARTMITMYERDIMFRGKISDANRTTCALLLQMSEIKTMVAAGKWPQCIDKIRALQILPLDAKGDPSTIRNYAAKFAGLSQPVAVNVANLLLWTVICCSQQRDRLASGQFSGNEAASRILVADLKQITVDLTTYTSQLRYRFPPYLLEALARSSAD